MGRDSLILSIVIPYYNTKKYTDELLDVLAPQVNDNVEVILVDDGSPDEYSTKHDWVKVLWQRNHGVAAARNLGLSKARGDYVAFVDSDDLVAEDYIEKIIKAAEGKPDYIEMSWRSLNTNEYFYRVSEYEYLENPSVCTRCFKRSFIGNVRFNEDKDAGEDEDFTRHLDISRGKRGFVSKYLYFYRTEVENSGVKRYKRGLKRTKQIVYYYPEITEDMIDLVAEVKKLDQKHEVYIMTDRNELRELEKYARVITPQGIWAHEARGKKTPLIKVIKPPRKTQVIIYIDTTNKYDGLTTWMFNFCTTMSRYYDIEIIHECLPINQINRLRKIVRVQQNSKAKSFSCDTLLMMRISAEVPENIYYKQIYQMVHCVKQKGYEVKRPWDRCVFVSETSQRSFNTDKGHVIYNLGNTTPEKKSLLLVSTTRVNSDDKGKQDERMIKLGRQLKRYEIPFVWIYFSENKLSGAPAEMVRMDPVDDVRDFVRKADFLVQLSDNEAFCYSIQEALQMGVPVLTVDMPILRELKFENGRYGLILPDDMNYDCRKLLNFSMMYEKVTLDSRETVDKWRKLLGNTTPTHDYKPGKMVRVKVITEYKDMELDELIPKGKVLRMWTERAEYLESMNLVKIVED
jgi:glycosyltransferase involved in cell wall biosynthesis